MRGRAGQVDSAAVTTRLVTVGMWLLILAGPVLGLAAVMTDTDVPATTTGARPSREDVVQRSAIGPGDFAIRYVTTWLSADGSDPEDMETIQKFFPDATELPPLAATRTASGLRVAAAHEVRPGYWAVTVVGQVVEYVPSSGKTKDDTDTPTPAAFPGLSYWQVGVLAHGNPASGGTSASREGSAKRPSYVATGFPSLVAAPAHGELPESGYGTAVDGAPGALGDTISEFLRLYLTGSSEISRYLAPNADISAPTRAPYLDSEVLSLAAAGDAVDLTTGGSPANGERLRMLATVQPYTDAGAGPPMQYALTLAGRADRWEVAALDPAPRLAGQ